MYRDDLFIFLVCLSVFCVLLLTGLYLYHGSFLPSLRGASVIETGQIILLWGAAVFGPGHDYRNCDCSKAPSMICHVTNYNYGVSYGDS